MSALLAQVEAAGTRPEALARSYEACRALDPDPIAIRHELANLDGDERRSAEHLLRRLVDMNVVLRDAVARAKTATQAEIEKSSMLQARLAHLAGPERSGSAFDAVS